jgi:lipid A 3-O-deacylase
MIMDCNPTTLTIGRRFCATVLFLLLLATAGLAQSREMSASGDYAAAIRREHWNFGVLASGGSGLFDRTDVQFVRGGFRLGRVLTGEIGSGALRGTFEWDAEITPVDYVLWSGYRNVYGVGVNPVILKWNFTGGRKVIPYVMAQAGALWSSHNVPPGNTSVFNFVTGPGVGFNYFMKPGRSVNVDLRATHLSNASLGTHNPGVNASLQLSVGYNWWKQ